MNCETHWSRNLTSDTPSYRIRNLLPRNPSASSHCPFSILNFSTPILETMKFQPSRPWACVIFSSGFATMFNLKSGGNLFTKHFKCMYLI